MESKFNSILEFGNNITNIGKFMSKQGMSIPDYEKYYSENVKIYNNFVEIINKILQKEEVTKGLYGDLILCEMDCWKMYINFRIFIKKFI